MTVQCTLYDEHTIADMVWPQTAYGAYARAYLLPLIREASACYIHNVDTQLLILSVDGIPLPVTVNDGQYDNSYVCSPYTHYVSYAQEELALLGSKTAERVLSRLLDGVGALMRRAGFNRVVQLNNWLVSTNLYPALSTEQWIAAVDCLRAAYPRHTLLIRSLNEQTTGAELAAFTQYGCRLVPSRQIYLLRPEPPRGTASGARGTAGKGGDLLTGERAVMGNVSGSPMLSVDRRPAAGPAEQQSKAIHASGKLQPGEVTRIPLPDAKARWLVKRDTALIARHGYEIVGPQDIAEQDIPRIVQLYDMLYIAKYSTHNPQFTASFIRLAREQGILQLYGLHKTGRLDAVLGFFSREGVMTTPLFGYDTGVPQQIGLYRMLSAVLIRLAGERGELLHESSGVGQFKRNRGAVPVLEVSAVYDRHMPLGVRASWSVLEQLLNHVGVPLIRKLKL